MLFKNVGKVLDTVCCLQLSQLVVFGGNPFSFVVEVSGGYFHLAVINEHFSKLWRLSASYYNFR